MIIVYGLVIISAVGVIAWAVAKYVAPQIASAINAFKRRGG